MLFLLRVLVGGAISHSRQVTAGFTRRINVSDFRAPMLRPRWLVDEGEVLIPPV